MKRRIQSLLAIICLFHVGIAWADQVSLKNGDRVTGKIQKKDGANLIIKSDLFGLVTIPWDAVTQVISDEPLTVVLPDGKSVHGKITGENQKLAVESPVAPESIDMAQVGAIRNADEQKAWERLGEHRLELGLDLLLRVRPDDLVRRLAALEEDHRRDREHAVLRGGLLVLVDVELDDLQGAVALVGDLLEDRSDDAAGAAPGCPEVDQDRRLGLEDLSLEVVVGDFVHRTGHGFSLRVSVACCASLYKV